MNQQDFDNVVKQTMETIEKLLVVKGGEYAGSEDRLSNFKRGASHIGCTPLQVAFIYLSKHYDAIATFVRDDATATKRERSEPIGGRIDDAINYLLLMKAIIVENEPHAVSININPAAMVRKDGGHSGERAQSAADLIRLYGPLNQR